MKQTQINHPAEYYENIFNAYEFENENNNRYVCYNILNKVSLPNDIDDQVFTYVTVPGSMPLTTISYRIYNNMHLWWLIMVVNKLTNPVKLLAPGTIIKVIKPQFLPQVLDSIKKA
jgi:hypothetical protein